MASIWKQFTTRRCSALIVGITALGWSAAHSTVADGAAETQPAVQPATQPAASEAGDDIAGVKTVTRSPADGLPYRIRMSPAANKDKPDRLLVWLHPSGASMNDTIEALAGKLVAHRVALMVFTQKDWNHWSRKDVMRMFKSLADAGNIPGITLSVKPLAIGFDVGGCLEMVLYQQNPTLFGGLALDGVMPMNIGSFPPLVYANPPRDPATRREPILVMLGAKDSVGGLWRVVADSWKRAGVPLQIVVVPGRGHEWLFDNADRIKLLTDWIDRAAAAARANGGGAPATQPTYDPADNSAYFAAAQKVKDMLKVQAQQMQNQRWADALVTNDALNAFTPHEAINLYNRACILARLGREKEAMETLDDSIDAGYVDSDHIAADPDLQSLHGDPGFAKSVLTKRIDKIYASYPQESAAEIPNVKTIEGARAGALRYRVRMGKSATAANPDRLVVWCHPTGASMDDKIEALVPELLQHHLALVVFTQKSYMGWNPEDAKRMLASLALIARIPGIDAHRPLMVGFSAGGQTLLQLYNGDPGAFGGVALDASYPIQEENGHLALMMPPKSPAIKDTPFLVIVGSADPDARLWPMVESTWRKRQVPLTIDFVAGRQHDWLWDNDDRQRKLIDWLAETAAGKLPGAPATQPATEPATQ